MLEVCGDAKHMNYVANVYVDTAKMMVSPVKTLLTPCKLV
jgi:hypothetical protein